MNVFLFILAHKSLNSSYRVYVDDLLIIGKKESIQEFKEEIHKVMKVKDLGKVSKLLSLNIRQESENELFVNQGEYVMHVLNEFQRTDCKGVSSPYNFIKLTQINQTRVLNLLIPICTEKPLVAYFS